MYEDILISYVQVTVWHSQVYFYSQDYVDLFTTNSFTALCHYLNCTTT